ncbi:MAG: hypothetical protein NC079_00445 [Clostridium sp.]|nr:hypothetical protein [Acetatifactor muris]MCM1527085.1 hypothetical protein [Bacteroides sp.]MCM1562061.1 hypothetical protein [Clostridium sp.]
MKKKINQLLNIIMGSFTGVFIGSGLYEYWHFKKYPDLYVLQSAPWYTSILIKGLFMLILLAICMIIKVILIEKMELIKKVALILGTIFLTLTFIGGSYVLINHGQVNAGYAVVPGIWALICFGYYRSGKRD